MKKLAAIVLGTALLISCSSKPANKEGYEYYTVTDSVKNLGLDVLERFIFKEKVIQYKIPNAT